MDLELALRIVLEKPPTGVDFGVQEGKGNAYTTIQKQRSKGKDLSFEFHVTVKDNREDGLPNFLGALAQGPGDGRFIYIDVGQFAGQRDCAWSRRMKIPLGGITWKLIEQVSADPQAILEARLPGTAKDGGPNCATVKPAGGWKIVQRKPRKQRSETA